MRAGTTDTHAGRRHRLRQMMSRRMASRHVICSQKLCMMDTLGGIQGPIWITLLANHIWWNRQTAGCQTEGMLLPTFFITQILHSHWLHQMACVQFVCRQLSLNKTPCATDTLLCLNIPAFVANSLSIFQVGCCCSWWSLLFSSEDSLPRGEVLISYGFFPGMASAKLSNFQCQGVIPYHTFSAGSDTRILYELDVKKRLRNGTSQKNITVFPINEMPNFTWMACAQHLRLG